MNRRNFLALAVFLVLAALHFTSVPRTIWEYDENLYLLGVERYQPRLHHPPPPGAPLYIAFVKLVTLATDPFHAMLLTSMLAVVAGLTAFFFAFREAGGESGIEVPATVLLYGCPAVLMSGTLPQADSGALALYGVAIFGCTRMTGENGGRNAALIAAVASALCAGWRPQFSIAVVPMFLTAAMMTKPWRVRLTAIAVFTVFCLAWLVPMMLATGGPAAFWQWISGQAATYAQHDAALSRSGQSLPSIALRFVAHPWGPKWLSIPLLAAAAGGALLLLQRREVRRFVPIAAGCMLYLAFAVTTMDPADAVRYAIPSLPLLAALAATALVRLPLAPLLALAYAGGSFWYASPILRTRATQSSPPAAAAAWIRANVPRNAIIVPDRPLGPHAMNLLRGYRTAASADLDSASPVFLYADGERGISQEGVTFRWPDTDAYRKLTRRHYGAVSVIPLAAEQRFRIVEGIHPPERTRDGSSWRWVAERGAIEIPDLGATHAELLFRAPPEYPWESNFVRIASGSHEATGTLRKGLMLKLTVPIDPATRRITISPERAFVPGDVAGSRSADRRTVSVMLMRVRQVTR